MEFKRRSVLYKIYKRFIVIVVSDLRNSIDFMVESQSYRVESAKPITFRHSNENRSILSHLIRRMLAFFSVDEF